MKKAAPVILLVVLALVTIFIRRGNQTDTTNYPNRKQNTNTYRNNNQRRSNSNNTGLNRNPSHINYSKHARCRMGCRHIDEREVKEILRDGTINYKKSELQADECHKRYAVEGVTDDDQKVRIIFAPCQDEVTVVTVIDLGEEWPCDCK